jgi:hypothetical protein
MNWLLSSGTAIASKEAIIDAVDSDKFPRSIRCRRICIVACIKILAPHLSLFRKTMIRPRILGSCTNWTQTLEGKRQIKSKHL